MFTGLIEEVGRAASVVRQGEGLRLRIEAGLAPSLAEGESVCVSGACLTVEGVEDKGFWATVMGETARKTTLGLVRPGQKVNLERALRLGDRLGGHMVSGHVDGVGRVRSLRRGGGATVMEVACPAQLRRFLAPRGSVALDGVSLTVAEVLPDGFRVALIPYTLEKTTIGLLRPGDRVNLEMDLLAKYAQRAPGGGEEIG